MNRSGSISICRAACAVVCAVVCAEAVAVEVTVKADTKLYGRDGTVLVELKAGTAFRADAVKGKWVWGAVVTDTGAARGWVPLAALEIDERARCLLAGARRRPGSAQPAKPKPEPILLRYKLEPDEVQTYEFTANVPATYILTEGQGSVEVQVQTAQKVVYTVRGMERDKKGGIVAEMRFKSFVYRSDVSVQGTTRRTTVNAGNDEHVRELLGTTLKVRFDERGQLFINREKVEQLAEELPGTDLEAIIASQVIFPAGKARPGGSWSERGDHDLDNPNRPGEKVPMTGKTRYTYAGRGTLGGKPCVKIALSSRYENRVDVLHREYRESFVGSAIVDEASGIFLSLVGTLDVQMAGVDEGLTYTAKGSGTIQIRRVAR